MHQSIDPLENVMTGMLTNAGFTIIRGSAKFVDSHTVQVADQCVTAENIVICTGQYDFKLPIPGNEYMHTSREILDLPELPGHITFIGAGIISMKFASLLTQFEVKATVIEFADRALLQYSEEYSNRVVEKLKSVGVDFHFGESLSEIEKKGDKYYAKTASGLCVETDYILAATGRRANVDDLDLEKAGVEYSPRGIKVDDHMTMEMMMGTIWAFPTQTDGLTEMLAPMLHSDMPKM